MSRGSKFYRGVEQLVARRAHNPKVAGSSPVPATKYFSINAGVAQLVEQLTCNQQVGGSIPLASSTLHYAGVAQW